ncbi:MAG: hypothetical protein CVV47_06120 [Spirochaetae bacterium HGW-Spirochaetae-3]|jgi:hypothetical protein|nr:MAG: hypothetical protein CVV47_06120 [Spirochaetae bacterium HGW-Spirochaetae-3]
MRPTRLVVAAVLLSVSASLAWSQSVSAPAAVSALPEPYTRDEFPSWAHGLRRFEIVSLGAFPIILFYTRFAFDLKRYADNGFEGEFVPWPFKNENSYEPSDAEQWRSVLTAAGVSVAFGALDAFLVWRVRLE